MNSPQKGQERDLPEMVDLLIQTWKECYSDFLPASFLANMDPQKQLERHTRYFQANTPYYLIRNEAEQLVGFTSYGKNRNASSPSELELYTLYVDQAYQGKGWGGTLLGAILSEAKGSAQSLEVSVLQKNPSNLFT